ncbi:hypothetical protein [Bradyrhizobium sp. CB2312]|uniref:hypothetical protein n=1 Tax=Bradyrhizobium sp. CB2312 TaxID=3039155 RepID=UPI0024B1BD65|nr:hypothetical protein [Bradyrhizobium sp. CB2312]WFU70948.1 hypothetical protein QA642_37680 [Bradyrhizobium sp. CB2312]
MKIAINLVMLACTLVPTAAAAGPSAEVARKCMHYSYVAYPYQRPGSVRMRGDRQAYFRSCMEKEGNIPAPETPSSSAQRQS